MRRRTTVQGALGAIVMALMMLAPAAAGAQQGTLAGLDITGLSPQFSPGVTQYTMPKASNCIATVTATLADPSNSLYIANGLAVSGTAKQTWICSGSSFAVVVYKGWTEVGRYTITPVDAPPPPPPPPAPALASLVVPGLSPA
ncbi:MAG: hypothetical protein AB7V01_23265, partial [Vicinamibacterales bacterium]